MMKKPCEPTAKSIVGKGNLQYGLSFEEKLVKIGPKQPSPGEGDPLYENQNLPVSKPKYLTVEGILHLSFKDLKSILGRSRFTEAMEGLEILILNGDIEFPQVYLGNIPDWGEKSSDSGYQLTLTDEYHDSISTLKIDRRGAILAADDFSDIAFIFLYFLLTKSSRLPQSSSFDRLRIVLEQLFLRSENSPPIRLQRVIFQSKLWPPDLEPSIQLSTRKEIITSPDMPFSTLSEYRKDRYLADALSWKSEAPKALLFEFTDGSVFTLATIFRTPYFWLMQGEIPCSEIISGLRNTPIAADWGDHIPSPTRYDQTGTVITFIAVFTQLLKKQLHRRAIRVAICQFDGKYFSPEVAFDLEGIDLPQVKVAWKIRVLSSSGNQDELAQSDGKEDDLLLTGHLNLNTQNNSMVTAKTILDLKSKRLLFIDLRQKFQNINFLLIKHGSRQGLLESGQVVENNEIHLKLDNQFRYREFAADLKKQNIDIECKVTEVNIRNQDELRVDFVKDREDFARISFFVRDENGHLKYLNQYLESVHQLISGISYGMAGYLNSDAKKLASKNAFTRPNELKLYKHSGLFLFMLLEYIHLRHSFNESSSSNDSSQIKKIPQEFYSRVERVALKIIGIHNNEAEFRGGGVQLIDMTGRKFIKNLKNIINDLFGEDHYAVTQLRNGQVYQLDFSQSIFQFLTLYADQISSHYQSKTFERSSFSAFSCRPSWSKNESELASYYPDDSEGYSGLASGALISLCIQKEGTIDRLPLISMAAKNCYISGITIETLSPDELHTQFQLTENGGAIDWFELNPQVYFKGEEIPRDQLVDFFRDPVVAYKGRYYYIPRQQIPSLKWLNYFWKKLSHKSELGSSLHSTKEVIKYEKSEILNMLALKEAGLPVVGGERWKKICLEYERLGSLNQQRRAELEHSLQNGFNTQLKSFQLEGVLWLLQLYHLGLGGILGDDMGLGKTVQTIAFLEYLRQQNALGPTLIIVPTSLVYNWYEEGRKFAPQMDMEIFDSRKADEYQKKWIEGVKPKSPSVIICTYGLLTDNLELFKSRPWAFAIFDEAQNLKNIKAKRSLAARELPAEHKFCLTGTPMENHLGEFFSLLDLSVPGALGPYQDFLKTYCSGKRAAVESDDLDFLKMKVKPLVLRRTKELVLNELPEKTETVVHMDFDKKQEKIYKDIAVSWNERIKELIDSDGLPNSQLQMLTALLRLRQVCSFPQTVPNVKYDQDPPKLKALLANLSELIENHHSVVVFTNFVATLDLIKLRLQQEGLPVLAFSGKDGVKKRREILSQFNDTANGPQVLLMTLKTGGVGLNLTKASYVFHLEPWWNPAAENQASDRVHRIGQTQAVQIYRFIMRNSVEEKIQELKKLKSEAFAALFSETEQDLSEQKTFSGSSLSREDFQMLLS